MEFYATLIQECDCILDQFVGIVIVTILFSDQ